MVILLAISKLLAIRTSSVQQRLASQRSFTILQKLAIEQLYQASNPSPATLSNPATPSNPTTYSDPSTFSDADDVTVMSSSQREEIHNNHSTPTASNAPEGSTTAVVAVMRGNPKDGYTRQRSNKHCKQNIVRVLLDSGSNGDLIFVNKDKPMLLPYLKKAGSTVVEYFKWNLPDVA
jgi:hypothetical protein